MPVLQKKSKSMKPARTLALGFLIIIIIGAALLCLPFSSKTGRFTNFIDCVFTAASATCVTGISLFDTFTHWTYFGQSVIMLLIQIGGLGFVTLVTFFNIALGKKIGLVKASEVTGDVTVNGIESTRRLFIRIITYSLAIEGFGAILLGLAFVPRYGGYGVFMAVFMAISAFCNAGFDLMGVDPHGMESITDNPLIMLTLSLLIFMGGIGFVVWENLAGIKKTKKLYFHSKVVLSVSGILVAVGFVGYFLIEKLNPYLYGHLSFGENLLTSFFASVSSRTAGFAPIPLPTTNAFSKVFTMALMFIGAGPGSTGGGIKVTTFLIMIATAWSVIKNKEDTEILKHRIPKNVVYKTLTVLFLSAAFISASFIIVYVLNPQLDALNILFEVMSSFTTTGFTAGVSDLVDPVSKVVLALTMYVGRIGPVSIILSLTMNKPDDKAKVLPVANIMVG